jgi:hypothetical protein
MKIILSNRQVEVFRTDVRGPLSAEQLIAKLKMHFPVTRITIDLKDCDRVLRIESREGKVDVSLVMKLVREDGFSIFPLD